MDYTIRGVCGQEGCRETRHYLENGLWFCRRGHQQEGRQVAEDQDDFGNLGKISRVKKATPEKSQKTYRGKQANTLYLQIYQLILWKQSYALIQDRGFPAQFEHVVRDLWALRLQGLARKFGDSLDSDGEDVFSSQAENGSDSDDPNRPRKRKRWPVVIDTLAYCYIAALLMRLPVTVMDIYRMAIRGDIPFFRILRYIPREMRDKLPAQYIARLEPSKLVSPEQVHKGVRELIYLYRHKYHMVFPPLNWPPILLQYIKRLALPIEIYPAVKNLKALVDFRFTYPERQVNNPVSASPDAQLVGLIVVATKLLFPFDKTKRFPTSANEPAAQAINWSVWEHYQRSFETRETDAGHIGKGKEILTTEQDALNMVPTQMDEYMDWFERHWINVSKAPNPVAEFFPTGRTGIEPKPNLSKGGADEEEAVANLLHQVTSHLTPIKPIPDKDGNVRRPGSKYRRYRQESELPEIARLFYEIVGNVSGFSLHTIVSAVFKVELQMGRWEERRRRREPNGEMLGLGQLSEEEEDEDEDEDIADAG